MTKLHRLQFRSKSGKRSQIHNPVKVEAERDVHLRIEFGAETLSLWFRPEEWDELNAAADGWIWGPVDGRD